MSRRDVILGAGVAGLAAAHEARRLGASPLILEAQPRVGGLLDGFEVEGFRFDNAVHLSFATETEVREVFDRTPHHTHEPEALNWDRDRWLRHPVQNNLNALDVDDRVSLVAGLAEAQDVEIRNYRDWLIAQYGQPLAERYPLSYTEKYWTLPAERLGVKWIGARMRRADLREVLRGAFTADTSNTYYVKEMRYPKEGGYRSFIGELIAPAQIRTGCRVSAIDTASRTLSLEGGERLDYDRLISTLPLPQLAQMVVDAPDRIRQLAATLFATSIDLISVGFSRPDVSPALWFYIYDRSILAARAYAPGWKSPDNVPAGRSSLQFEIYSSRERPPRPVEAMKTDTRRAIVSMGLAREEEILFVHHKHLPFGNVVFDLGMEERRDEVRSWLSDEGVSLAGRFGEWDYLWSNQSMMSGIVAARRAFD